jgi:hypothetical protein
MRGAKACLAKLLAEAREEIAAWERGERPEFRVVSYYTYDDGSVERVDKQGDHVVREIIPPRAGWDQSFARMAAEGDDQLLDPDAATSTWDNEEWEWPADP